MKLKILLPSFALVVVCVVAAPKQANSDSLTGETADAAPQSGVSLDHARSDVRAQTEQAQKLGKQSMARVAMSPHTLTIQSELRGALDHVKAIRTELKNELMANAEGMDHFKLQSRQINDELKIALTHDKALSGEAAKFPDVAKSNEYKAVAPAINEVQKLNLTWQGKVNSKSYWNNKDQAMTDLDSFETRLNEAIDKTKSLNSKLSISSELG